MSSRPQFNPYPVISSASMTGNVTSKVTVIQKLSQIGYDISWTGTPVGTFSVQISNTYSQNAAGAVTNAGTWTTLTLSNSPAASGSAGSGYIDITGCSAYAMRLVYTAGSSTGTLNATINAKVA